MMMDKALNLVRFDCAEDFIDDCLVHSESREKHFTDLERTLKCIENANIKLRPTECEFFQRQIKFLGHIISSEGIETGDDKINAILDVDETKNVTENH
ncbi:pol polyprotein-like protein [Dinothrombium tinctorium]|uniref:Pol polyprotein-like protein n=1 Tax=Dinothrombium tinctorium TaxID=1965070 RepID=A0A443QY43_9ACAR|nr:pol polyprotein-like protein [Dinothrombium tinctorium]